MLRHDHIAPILRGIMKTAVSAPDPGDEGQNIHVQALTARVLASNSVTAETLASYTVQVSTLASGAVVSASITSKDIT